MSPLACSLLAFIALFVADVESKPNRYCRTVKLGKVTKDFINFSLTVAGGEIKVPDKSTRPGRKLVGELVSVCNEPHSKPIIIPRIRRIAPHQYRPNFGMFRIICPSNITGCDKLDFHVRQYWEMVTAPH